MARISATDWKTQIKIFEAYGCKYKRKKGSHYVLTYPGAKRKEVVHDVLVEVMGDIAMVRAIQDGENSGPASRDDIFQILEGKEGSA